MNLNRLNNKILKWIFCISALFSMILLITIFVPTLYNDEAFSMGLINHNYLSMLHLSYFDVHPPLYYLILKTFLIITTFWTKSVLVKIMFARILSVLCFFITFYVLCLTLKEFNIKIRKYLQLTLYLVTSPTIIFMTQVRMYELAITFLAVELYELVKFTKYNKIHFLIIATLSASLASYTHYFAAMFAGSFLLVYMLRMLQLKNWKKLYEYIGSILIFILLFIPCSWFAYRQFTYVSSSKYTNILANSTLDKNIFVQIIGAASSINFHSIAETALGIIIVCILVYLTMHYSHIISNELNKLLINLILVFSISVLVPLIFSFLSHPIIQGRYYYPIVSIYEFILIGIILNYFNWKNISKLLFSSFIIILLCFSFGNLFKAKSQYKNVDLSSLYGYRRVVSLPYYNHIILTYKHDNLEQESIYLENKKLFSKLTIVEARSQIKNYLGTNNEKLLNGVFSNMNIKYVK